MDSSGSSQKHDRLFLPITARANGAAFLVFLLLSLCLQLPGNVPFDGIVEWYEGRTGVLFAQHPAAHVLLWRLSDLIGPGPELLTALQLLLLWLAVYLLIRREQPSAWLAGCFYLAMLLFPPIVAMSGLLVKDILGANLCILAIVLAARPKNATRGSLAWAASFSMIALAALVRYQLGVYALAVFGQLWRAACERKYFSKSEILASLAGVVATLAIVVTATMLAFVHRGASDVEQSLRKVLLYDIAGIAYYRPDVSLPDFVEAGANVELIKADVAHEYSTYRVDTLWEKNGAFTQFAKISDRAVLAEWLYNVSHDFRSFLLHRTTTFERTLGFGEVYECRPVFGGISRIPSMPARYVGAQSYTKSISAYVVKSHYFPAGTFLFKPWCYGLAAILILIGFFLRNDIPFDAAILSGSGLLYEFTFLLTPQACDVRYSYPLILGTTFAVSMIVFRWSAGTFKAAFRSANPG